MSRRLLVIDGGDGGCIYCVLNPIGKSSFLIAQSFPRLMSMVQGNGTPDGLPFAETVKYNYFISLLQGFRPCFMALFCTFWVKRWILCVPPCAAAAGNVAMRVRTMSWVVCFGAASTIAADSITVIAWSSTRTPSSRQILTRCV